MSPDNALPVVAVDIGNSRLKFGRFDSLKCDVLPEPTRTWEVAPGEELDEMLASDEFDDREPVLWRIGSVNRRSATQVIDWLRRRGAIDRTMLLASFDLPLVVKLDQPDFVGIDRLLGAVAVNRCRDPARPAIVVDLGSAITVDAISPQGEFLGGAILPGIGMSARALHHFTDLLPLVDLTALGEPPPPIGTSTVEAMTAGLFWGAIGAARQLVERYAELWPSEPQVVLTGGAAPQVAPLISTTAECLPNLTLAGIALAVPS